jgi:hypothetical protein
MFGIGGLNLLFKAARYSELKLLQQAGVVQKFELQTKYRGKDGKLVRAIKYRADFRILWRDDRIGAYRTEKYRLKKKLLLAKYPIRYTLKREIKRSGSHNECMFTS